MTGQMTTGKSPSYRKMENHISDLEAENQRLRADKENWQKVCEGALKEQFRLADKRELEARLELALRELDKAAAEIERLSADIDYHLNAIGTLTTENERLQADLARMTKNEDLQMHRAIRAEALNAELLAALRPFVDARTVDTTMRKKARRALEKMK